MAAKYWLHENSADLVNLGGFLALLHGGAGPQDPRGKKAEKAASTLRTTLDSLFMSPSSACQQLRGIDCVEGSFSHSFWHPEWVSAMRAQFKGQFDALPAPGAYALSAVAALEREPVFNAGYGSALQRDGVARVSSSYMDSVNQKFSSVINVPDCLHPSLLAAYLQSQKHSMRDSLGGAGLMAEFALKPTSLVSSERFEQWVLKRREALVHSLPDELGTGTVGAVVVDASGSLCAVTSTGGVGFEPVGRVGDSGTVSGNYVTSNFAASCTGYGEQITDLGFSVQIAARIAAGQSLHEAFGTMLKQAAALGYGLAAICAHVDGKKVYWACGTTEEYFVWSYRTAKLAKSFVDDFG